MNQKNAINVINIMKKWALENNLSLLLFGLLLKFSIPLAR